MVEEITIADGLTELKRIVKLIEKRRENIFRYASKRRGSKDEIDNQRDFIKSEFDSCKDLITRYADIKLAINKSNLFTQLEFMDKQFTVAEAILFKQQFYEMKKGLYDVFSPNTGNRQVDHYINALRVGSLDQDQLEKLDLVPELLYDEKKMISLKEENLNLYSYVDALIEKSNHNTVISI